MKSPSLVKITTKKGFQPTLCMLSKVDLFYNELKYMLNENEELRISSRTFDYLLKTLLNYSLIERCTPLWADNHSNFYRITSKGVILSAVLSVFHESINSLLTVPLDDDRQIIQPLNLDLTLNENYEKSCKYRKIQFNDIWPHLVTICLEKKILNTFPNNKPNQIQIIDPNHIRIFTEQGVEVMDAQTVRITWNHFLHDGILQKNDYEKSSYRSSFLFALFMELPFVQIHTKKPLQICLELSKIAP